MDPTPYARIRPVIHIREVSNAYRSGGGYGNGLFAMPDGNAHYRPPYIRAVLITPRHLVHIIDYAHLRAPISYQQE